MLLPKVSFGIDWKHKTFHIYHDDDNSEQIKMDDNGFGELLLDMFKSLDMTPLKPIIELLDEIVTTDQKQAILHLWGNTNQIMISSMANVCEGNRILAKKILELGETRQVLTRGPNCSWKVIDKEIQKTMKESAERIKRGPRKEPLTFEESAARVELQKEKYVIQNFVSEEENKHESEDVILEEETIEVIPEEPIKKVPKINIEAMKQDLKDMEELKEQMRSGTIAETIKCNEHMLNDKIKTLKVEIINAEMQLKQSSHRGVPTGKLGIINITIAGQKPILSLPQKKEILSKEKPAQGKGVRKKK